MYQIILKFKISREQGRQKITQITRYGTVILATIQGFGLAVGLESSANLVLIQVYILKFLPSQQLLLVQFLMWLRANYTKRHR